jgi:hypothetical protein
MKKKRFLNNFGHFWSRVHNIYFSDRFVLGDLLNCDAKAGRAKVIDDRRKRMTP